MNGCIPTGVRLFRVFETFACEIAGTVKWVKIFSHRRPLLRNPHHALPLMDPAIRGEAVLSEPDGMGREKNNRTGRGRAVLKIP